MITQPFESILQDVGRLLGIPLKPDEHNSCLIQLTDGVSLQMEVEPNGKFFVIGADLGPVPLGKYRENIFQAALKANDAPYPKYGAFAYSKEKDHLVLFKMLPLQDLRAEKIVSLLLPLSEKALKWKTAISKGEIPQQEPEGASLGNLFGMK